MARIFITGSADGLGQMAAKLLIAQRHKVVLHARNEARGRDAMKHVPGAEYVLIADLSDMQETKKLAKEVNELGVFDAVIHNAGVYNESGKVIFAVNTLAPYILTCMIEKPKRLVYLSSGMHMSGGLNPDKPLNMDRVSYSDSKLHVLMLSIAVARKWPDVYSNTVNPGWVATKMGGSGAPDSLEKGFETQAWLATSNDDRAKVNGRYFYHKQENNYNKKASNIALQEKLLMLCGEISGISFPA